MTKSQSHETSKKPVKPTVSRETLDETPARALVFLRGVGTVLAIRAALMDRGYTSEEHQKGWALLHAVSGYVPDAPIEGLDVKVRDAINELDRWDEDGFRIVRAALNRLHPDQAEFVLEGIGPTDGPGAVLGVKTLLERLDTLEKGSERKATRKEDHAALETLAKRGLGEKERARLAALVDVAQSAEPVAAPDEKTRAAREEKQLAGLVALRAWFEDWTEMARVVVKRRDYLIRLGLAKRKVTKKTAPAAPGATQAKPPEPAANGATPPGSTVTASRPMPDKIEAGK